MNDTRPVMPLTKTQKIATLLVALGEEKAAAVLEILSADEVSRITHDLIHIDSIPQHARRAVLREFQTRVNAEERRNAGFTFARQVLDKALGGEKADEIIGQVSSRPHQVDFINNLTPDMAVKLLDGEPAHIAAMLLLSMSAENAASTLDMMPDDKKIEIAKKVTILSAPGIEAMSQLDKAFKSKADKMRKDGFISIEVEKPVVKPVVNVDVPMPETPETEHRVSFFDFIRIDMTILRPALSNVNINDISIALIGADDELKRKIVSALPLSRRMSLQRKASVRPLSEINQAQESVASAVMNYLSFRKEESVIARYAVESH
ncbi:MAG: FliG C-terminal domain-containing protein [bacterium]